MPLRDTSPSSGFVEIDRWPGGLGWLAHPDETMARASHALCVERPDEDAPDDVWVVDPLGAPGIDDRLQSLGNVVGVVVLLDRHQRDSVRFARRHDVPLYVPAWVEVDAPSDVGLVRVEDRLPGTEYELLEPVDLPGWHEAALTDGDTLLVADALGTADYVTTDAERIGVHPLLRLTPPRALHGRHLAPRRILVGHGEGIADDATTALRDALSGARRRLPRLLLQEAKRRLRGATRRAVRLLRRIRAILGRVVRTVR